MKWLLLNDLFPNLRCSAGDTWKPSFLRLGVSVACFLFFVLQLLFIFLTDIEKIFSLQTFAVMMSQTFA